VEVIGHETIRQDAHRQPLASLADQLDEGMIISVFEGGEKAVKEARLWITPSYLLLGEKASPRM
jgi:hypothetical protein